MNVRFQRPADRIIGSLDKIPHEKKKTEIVRRPAQNSGDEPQQGLDTKTDILNKGLTE